MNDLSKSPVRNVAPARIHHLTDHQDDNLADTTTVEERIAMVTVLSRRMWEISGHPLPSYSRSEMPMRVVRLG